MAKIIIEEYENQKLSRILRINKEKIINVDNIEISDNISFSSLEQLPKIEERIGNYLKEKLQKSEYELSSLINQPFYDNVYKLLVWYHGNELRLTMGFRTIIDLEDGRGIFCRASIESIYKALKSDKDVIIRVYFRREGEKYKIEKEEVTILE